MTDTFASTQPSNRLTELISQITALPKALARLGNAINSDPDDPQSAQRAITARKNVLKLHISPEALILLMQKAEFRCQSICVEMGMQIFVDQLRWFDDPASPKVMAGAKVQAVDFVGRFFDLLGTSEEIQGLDLFVREMSTGLVTADYLVNHPESVRYLSPGRSDSVQRTRQMSLPLDDEYSCQHALWQEKFVRDVDDLVAACFASVKEALI